MHIILIPIRSLDLTPWMVFFSMFCETVLLDLLLHCHNIITFSLQSTIGMYNPTSIYTPFMYSLWMVFFSMTQEMVLWMIFFSMTREMVLLDLLLHSHNEITFSFESTVDAYIPNSYMLLRCTARWVVFFSMTRETVLLDLLLHCHNEITFS